MGRVLRSSTRVNKKIRKCYYFFKPGRSKNSHLRRKPILAKVASPFPSSIRSSTHVSGPKIEDGGKFFEGIFRSSDPNIEEVLDWTPAERDEEITDWNPNPTIEHPPITNPPWVPYYVDWQPPPPAETVFRRIVDLDELKNGTSDLIDPNIQDNDENIHIKYTEISAGQLDHLHKIDEHPLTTSQAEKMKCTIDEETFPEIPLPEYDDDDPWKNIEEQIKDRHLIKNSVFKKCGSVHLNTPLNRIERPGYPHPSA